jgi:hypothetical protein
MSGDLFDWFKHDNMINAMRQGFREMSDDDEPQPLFDDSTYSGFYPPRKPRVGDPYIRIINFDSEETA